MHIQTSTHKDLTTDNVHTIAEMQNSIMMLERKFFGCRLLYRCVCTFSHFNKWPTDLLCATKEDITQQRAKQTKPNHTRPNEQEKLLSKCVGGKTISWENNDVYFNKFTCTYTGTGTGIGIGIRRGKEAQPSRQPEQQFQKITTTHKWYSAENAFQMQSISLHVSFDNKF